jgi:hypothetical protein
VQEAEEVASDALRDVDVDRDEDRESESGAKQPARRLWPSG